MTSVQVKSTPHSFNNAADNMSGGFLNGFLGRSGNAIHSHQQPRGDMSLNARAESGFLLLIKRKKGQRPLNFDFQNVVHVDRGYRRRLDNNRFLVIPIPSHVMRPLADEMSESEQITSRVSCKQVPFCTANCGRSASGTFDSIQIVNPIKPDTHAPTIGSMVIDMNPTKQNPDTVISLNHQSIHYS